MGFRVAMTLNAPRHGELLRLINDFHLIDPPVAGLATDARIHMGGVVEVNEFRQIVHTFPTDAPPRLPAFVDRSKLVARGVYRRQGRHPLIIGGAVAVHASRRWGNRRVRRVKHRVVAVSTIQFKLARVQGVTEWNRLSRLVADVQRDRVGNQSAHGGRKYASRGSGDCQQAQKWIGPAWKQKPLHDVIWPAIVSRPLEAQKSRKFGDPRQESTVW